MKNIEKRVKILKNKLDEINHDKLKILIKMNHAGAWSPKTIKSINWDNPQELKAVMMIEIHNCYDDIIISGNYDNLEWLEENLH